mmetsp:Transcript_88724/g.153572  ORF Transcript_88724/g.153572 Transcript_88724/m.153572 type:complete len:231 (+) Transcript_88724:448-1140(+)
MSQSFCHREGSWNRAQLLGPLQALGVLGMHHQVKHLPKGLAGPFLQAYSETLLLRSRCALLLLTRQVGLTLVEKAAKHHQVKRHQSVHRWLVLSVEEHQHLARSSCHPQPAHHHICVSPASLGLEHLQEKLRPNHLHQLDGQQDARLMQLLFQEPHSGSVQVVLLEMHPQGIHHSNHHHVSACVGWNLHSCIYRLAAAHWAVLHAAEVNRPSQHQPHLVRLCHSLHSISA